MTERSKPVTRMLGRRLAPEEPEEQPSRLGWELLRVQRETPGKWVDVMDSDHRSTIRDLAARVAGRSKNRIAGIMSTDGWEGRMVDVYELAAISGQEPPEGENRYVLRVRYTPPEDSPQVIAVPNALFDELRRGSSVEKHEAVDPADDGPWVEGDDGALRRPTADD